MKILVITENVGRTAPGIVFERLIHGLSSFHQIDLLTADYDPSIDLSNLEKIVISKKKEIHPRIFKFFLSFLGVNLFDRFWANDAVKKINNNTVQYDLVLSFLSFQHYAALIAGTYFCKKYNVKLAAYSVDAIPAPIGWLNHDRYYLGLDKMIEKYLSKVDAFFSSNPQMLEYQLKKITPKTVFLSDVVYNSGVVNSIEYPKISYVNNNFLYTGGIYGVRKAEYLLQGFEKLLEEYPDSRLIFVGSHLLASTLLSVKPQTIDKIEIVPFTKDLTEYYRKATALIDIDADIENDVFLSSKMTNYIMINRMIISETGTNSPSRHLFKGIDSILQCGHDSDQICEAMKKVIIKKESIDFSDRKVVMELFDIDNIVSKLNINLNLIDNSSI
jgi:glycosyltransferase involved in cell wall biosynthesis